MSEEKKKNVRIFIDSGGFELEFAGERFQIPQGKLFEADIDKEFGEKLAAHGVTAKELLIHASTKAHFVPVNSSSQQRADVGPVKRFTVGYEPVKEKKAPAKVAPPAPVKEASDG